MIVTSVGRGDVGPFRRDGTNVCRTAEAIVAIGDGADAERARGTCIRKPEVNCGTMSVAALVGASSGSSSPWSSSSLHAKSRAAMGVPVLGTTMAVGGSITGADLAVRRARACGNRAKVEAGRQAGGGAGARDRNRRSEPLAMIVMSAGLSGVGPFRRDGTNVRRTAEALVAIDDGADAERARVTCSP